MMGSEREFWTHEMPTGVCSTDTIACFSYSADPTRMSMFTVCRQVGVLQSRQSNRASKTEETEYFFHE